MHIGKIIFSLLGGQALFTNASLLGNTKDTSIIQQNSNITQTDIYTGLPSTWQDYPAFNLEDRGYANPTLVKEANLHKKSRKPRQSGIDLQQKGSNPRINPVVNKLNWLREDVNDFKTNFNQTIGTYQFTEDYENRLHILSDRLNSIIKEASPEYVGKLQTISRQIQSLQLPLNEPKIINKKDIKELADPVKKLRKPRQLDVGPQPPDENVEVMTNLRNLQEDVNDLKNRINGITTSTVSLTDVLRIKNDSESRIATLTVRLDNIKKGVSQKYSIQINTINQQVQGLQYQLSSINTILLQKVQDIERRVTEQANKNEIQRESDRKDNKQRAIQDCISAIRDGQIEQAKTKWQHIIELDTNKHWHAEVGRIIRDAYAGSLSYFDKVDNFIRNGLPFIAQAAIGYETLIEEMKRNGDCFNPEMIRIGYRIKEYMEMPNYPNVGQEYKNIYESLKSSFPSAINNLLWNTVCIKNTEYNENLFADLERTYNSDDRRHVFTWRPGGVVGDAYWKFIPENDAKRFAIKNIQYNEYLYAAADYYAYDSGRRNVFTWKQGTTLLNGRWVVEPRDQSSVYIKLSPDNSIGKVEYLYAAGENYAHDSKRRRVFTWREGNPVTNGYWYIDDCSNRRRRSLLDKDVEDVHSQPFTDKVKLANETLSKNGISISGKSVNVNFTTLNSHLTKDEKKLSLNSNFKNKLLFFRQKPFQISSPSNETLLFSNLEGVKNNHEVTSYEDKMNTTLLK